MPGAITRQSRRISAGYLDLKNDCGLRLDGVKDGSGVWSGTDDGPALLAAITRGMTENKLLVHPGGAAYLATAVNPQAAGYMRLTSNDIENSIIVQGGNPATVGSSVYMDPTTHVGTGALLAFGGYGSAFQLKQNLTADAHKGDLVITAASFAGYNVGDWVNIGSDEIWAWSDHSAKIGELAKITAKTSTTITIDRPLQDDYLMANTAIVQRATFKTAGQMSIEGISFINNNPGTHNNGFMRLSCYEQPVVRDCDFIGPDGPCVVFASCDGFRADTIRFFDGNDEPDRAGYVYGVVAEEATCSGLVTNIYGRRMRHVFTTTAGASYYGIPRDIRVMHGIGEHCTNAAWDSHAEGDRIYFSDLVARNCRAFGFDIRSPRSTLRDFECWDSKGPGVLLRAFDCEISDGRIYRPKQATVHLVAGDSPGSLQPGCGVHVAQMTTWSWGGGDAETQPPAASTGEPSVIRDIEVLDAQSDGLLIADGVSNLVVENLTVRRCGGAAVKGTGTWSGARFRNLVVEAPGTYGWDLAATISDVSEEATQYRSMGAAPRWNTAGFRPTPRFRRYEMEPGNQPGVVLPDGFLGGLGTVGLSGTTARWAKFRLKRDLLASIVSIGLATADTTNESVEVAFYDVTANPAAPPKLVTTGAVAGLVNSGTNVVKTMALPPTLFEAGRDYAYLICWTDTGVGGDTDASLVCASFSNLVTALMFGSTMTLQRYGSIVSTAAGSSPATLVVDASPASVSIPLIGLRES